MRLIKRLFFIFIALALFNEQSYAWGPEGHHTIGAIADRMLEGTMAEKEVKKILGEFSLRDIAVWPDCVKGINPHNDYVHETLSQYPECRIFETPGLVKEMSDFVRRNDTNCHQDTDEATCHRQYHYTDISISKDYYDTSFMGARDADIVHALAAAIEVLKGNNPPVPFNINDKREALFLLVHYVGDIHQPLHVGALYLDEDGNQLKPDNESDGIHSSTGGGTNILIDKTNMHAMWDSIQASLEESRLDAAMLESAKAIPTSNNDIANWPEEWATDTLQKTKLAFTGITFEPKQNGVWKATLRENYTTKMQEIKTEQVFKAGARLAQVLRRIWP